MKYGAQTENCRAPKLAYKFRVHQRPQENKRTRQFPNGAGFGSTTSLTIISCKYENRQRLQFTTEFAKNTNNNTKNKHCAILPSLCRHCQSKAKHSRIWAQAMPFCPSNKLTFDLLTLKVVSESRMTSATSVPNLVFLGLSVLDLGPMYVTDRRQTASSLNAPAY